MERIATISIFLGGMGTILAVLLIFVFLVAVTLPLFNSGSLGKAQVFPPQGDPGAIAAVGVGPHEKLMFLLETAGALELIQIADGTTVERLDLHSAAGQAPSAWSLTPAKDLLSLGYPDGTLIVRGVRFADTFLAADEALELAERHPEWDSATPLVEGGGLIQRTSRGELRRTRLRLGKPESLQPHGPNAVVLADASKAPAGLVMALLTADGQLSIDQIDRRYDMIDDREIQETFTIPVPYEPRLGAADPKWMVLDDLGRWLFLAWEDGWVRCYGVGEDERASLVDERSVLPSGATRLTALAPLLGKRTLVLADDSGELCGWFVARGDDGVERLIRAHQLPNVGDEVIALAASTRSRLVAALDRQGRISVIQTTTENLIAQQPGGSDPASRPLLAFADSQAALFEVSSERTRRFNLSVGYPEATPASLFLPVLYEDYSRPAHAWQSTGGSNDFEPKFGMTPLVFGTLKATVYSLLFGAPIALLAAIFTSEYLKGRLRSTVKSVLELMASLPTVVLGFLAATIIAPFVRDSLPSVLACFLTLPLMLMFGAHLWQLQPRERVLRWAGWQRFLGVLVALALALPVAVWLGPLVESGLFGGDLKAWLRGTSGSGRAGWWVLFLPLGGLATVYLFGSVFGSRLRRVMLQLDQGQQATLALAKFVIGLAVSALLALAMASLLGDGLGIDPRGSVVGPYDERNALVVGFVMGFAIIPIIYTLAEDALSSVPDHLREASLGAGATPWQTATRVIIPTAMSGLFSALMIGLGRAVGETMIVLMATGGTAIMDWSVFNGFRTLSANIATELPEAAAGSTHYRVLFLAGLVLFAITFVLNTLAEFVRQRFRKRAFQL